MTTPTKIGVLVAIPIKGRKLMNRSGGKQSPYVQLKLGEQKKRTKPSLIAAAEPEWDQEASLVRLDVFQGQMDMNVSVYDEGKKNELIGEGILLLHEVVDKGELDVWFPIKYNGTTAGDIYFELTFYAAAPLPAAGATPPIPQAQIQTPIRHTQPGYQGPGILPHTPPLGGYGSPPVGPPTSFPPYNATPRPFPSQPFPAAAAAGPYGAPPTPGPGFNQPFGGASPFRPPGTISYPNNTSPQFGNPSAGGYPHMPQPFAGGNNAYPPNSNNNNGPPRFPVPQHSSPGGVSPLPSFSQGPGGPPNSFPSNGPNNSNLLNNGPPHSYPNNNNFPGNGPNNNSFPNNGPNNNNFPNNGPNHNNYRPNNNFPNNGPNNSYPNNGPTNNFPNNGPNNNNNFQNNGPNNNNFQNNGPNNNFSGPNNNFNNNNNNGNHPPGIAPVTPLMQYNYSLGGSFP
ncbi:hypothetical protein BGZ49_000711 [Haplosporangium sp. Z 27]|nr:hypothetical protein BGZ49_000711 [Haplosporangium sp. Z 27]